MSKQKCDYCGKEVDAEYMSTLENGSPACPECVAVEESATSAKKNDATSNEKKPNSIWDRLKLWVTKNKKKAILIACAIVLVLATIIIVTATVGGDNSGDGSSERSFEEKLESKAIAKARGNYLVKYDVSSVGIKVTSVQQRGENWRVAGKVYAKDAYGDSYSGNWSITYDENMNVVDSDFATPRKD